MHSSNHYMLQCVMLSEGEQYIFDDMSFCCRFQILARVFVVEITLKMERTRVCSSILV